MSATDGPRDGATFDAALDTKPLNEQARRVYEALSKGSPLSSWLTLAELAEMTRAPQASVSARIRDLRKPRFGGHVVARRRAGRVWEYRLTGERVQPDPAAAAKMTRVPRGELTTLRAYRAAVENVRELCNREQDGQPPVYVAATDVLELLPRAT